VGRGGWSLGLVSLALALGLLGCGGSGKSAATTSAPSTSAPTTAAVPSTSAPNGSSPLSSATAAGTAPSIIAKNWTAFFDAKTPTAQRVALLQNGQEFVSIIGSQAGAGLAASVTAKVTDVALESATQAKVTYSILLSGTPVLANQSGVAVLQGGTWKIGDSSFCGLLTLENTGKTSGLPAACAGG
jgi:hypothetical protein